MSSDLKDYLYLEAKEKAFEIEIESRKAFEKKRNVYLNEEKKKLRVLCEKEDTAKENVYRQFGKKGKVEIDKPNQNQQINCEK